MQKDFNSEMSRYLNKRVDHSTPKKKVKVKEQPMPKIENDSEITIEDGKPSFWSKLFAFVRSSDEDYGDVEVINDEPKPVQESVEELENEYVELEAIEDKIENKKGRILSRLFSKINFLKRDRDADMGDVQMAPEMDEEVKTVLKLVHKWILKLPPEEMKAFKESADFELYKAVLAKYKLIK